MSQHIVLHSHSHRKWVYGWDQPLQSFYLQVHDLEAKNPDDNPFVWLGADRDSVMYEVEDLVRAAKKHGLDIPYEMQIALDREKDSGR